MILVCGIPSEPPVRLVIEAATRAEIPFVVFNPRQAAFTEITISLTGETLSGRIRIQEQDWPLEAFQGVYVRLIDLQDLPETGWRNSQEEVKRNTLVHQALLDWLAVTSCRVMNRPADMASNFSKPYQAQLIAAAGFAIPATLVSNNPRHVVQFKANYPNVIYKSTSSVRSIVHKLSESPGQDFEKVRNLPTQFQEFIPGEDIRVHVVGQKIFATNITSPEVDYRYSHNSHLEAIDIDSQTKTRCLELVERLNLPLCGIDFKRDSSGELVCLEVNPSPGFSFYQEQTGQDIAGAIVEYLEGK
jgi:glutathione synthase/RimK-type ligase-like ATP-grasp enzyme